MAVLSAGAVGAAPSAQQSTTASSTRGKTGKAAPLVLKGCVAEASGHYLLNRAIVVAPPAAPAPAAARGAAPVGANSDDQVYELVGAAVKPHVGHQVEVTGTAADAAATSGASAQPNDVKQTAHPMAGTVNVKSIKMLTATCP
jgi:hypothetical protein